MPESITDRGAKKSTAAPHAASIESVIANLRTSVDTGLDDAQASRAFQTHGPNELQREPPVPAWKLFVAQFRELVIVILIVAALISGALGDWIDTIAILSIVLVNGIIGYFQQSRAEQALAALDRLSAPLARVLRGERWLSLEARQLVPGDIIELESGDFVPADVRLVQAFGLFVQEASLTGESAPVEKDSAASCSINTPLAERSNMAYMSTVVTSGKSKAIVVATGNQTELGLIAGLLKRQKPEPTPLQNRLSELGKILIYLCIALVVLIFALQVLHGEPIAEAFLLSVSLMVAAVPEGLPAVVTIALAIVLKRMVKRNALVRRLPSVETLGSVTVICSDKTGTLTRNEMTVREVHVATGQYRVTGAGYSLHGSLYPLAFAAAATIDKATIDEATVDDENASEMLPEVPRNAIPPDLSQAILVGSVCNNARLTVEDDESCSVLGDPTEAALLVLAGKTGFKQASESILYELPFESNRKAMSVLVQVGGENWLYTKGAPEVVLARSTSELRNGVSADLDESRRSEIVNSNRTMASRALRVLGLAMKKMGNSQSIGDDDETDLVFVGLVGMIDPPRVEVREAVLRCNDAGIKPVMITGDHPDTALAIARELGIAGALDSAVSGPEVDVMSDIDLARRVADIPVYARVTAEHKMRIVNAWKANNQIVAMTGDGVNDSPAVRAADIGIAMGITGTDVTKQASDMVLVDDNFTSIVNAVEEGRCVYDNIQKFVHFLLSCNAGEVLLMLVAAVLGWPIPLVAIQLLWINLVTDGLPALALGMESPERDIMKRSPREPHAPVISVASGLRMLLHGTLIAVVAAIGFWLTYQQSSDVSAARTVAFCVAAFSQLFYAFSCRSFRYTLPELGFLSNPFLVFAVAMSALLQLAVVTLPFARPIFAVVPIPLESWGMIILLSLTPVTLIEISKLVLRAIGQTGKPQRNLLMNQGPT